MEDPRETVGAAPGARAKRILLTGAALLCIAWGVRGLAASYYASRPGPAGIAGLERAVWLTPENWHYQLRLGEILSALGEHEHAIARFHEAIDAYPACAVCWMSLAEAQAALRQDPSEAIEKAVASGRSQPTTRLRAATLYAMLGRDEEAGREFGAAQRGVSDSADDLYVTLQRLYPTEFLLDHVFAGADLGGYFGFVLKNRPLADARLVWERLRGDGLTTPDWQRSTYAQLLLRAGSVHEAWEVRFSEGPPPQAAVLDGSFEQRQDVRPFGWYMTQTDGVRAEVASCDGCPEGTRALHLVFDGKHNPRYAGTWQDVPVRPGARYVLSGSARVDHVTSASGPRLAVKGIGSRPGAAAERTCDLWAAGPEWKLASPWREFRIEFRVPEDCDGVRIMVTRKPTDQFNKFLGGQLWIDALSLSEAPPAG